jgi:hypothetical protein
VIGDEIVIGINDRRRNGDERNSMGRNDDDAARCNNMVMKGIVWDEMMMMQRGTIIW